jgi:hypothetical protein
VPSSKQSWSTPVECPALVVVGSPARTRTTDPMVNSHLLYRLSYRGIGKTLIIVNSIRPCKCQLPSYAFHYFMKMS